ncbi:unnamed protein product [Ascophyllum nodosum]
MAILNRPQSTAAPAQPVAQPVTHAAAQGQIAVPVQQQGCCSVPPGTTQSVKTSRRSSIAVIVIHALALSILGFFNYFQWIASLMGIIMGSILLCVFSRCCYITATVLYSIGIIFDILAMLAWFFADGYAGLAVVPALGAVSFLIGAIATGMAVCNWHNSGAPDTVVQKGSIQIVQHAPTPSINATVVQPNYAHPAASRVPPPTYSSTV